MFKSKLVLFALSVSYINSTVISSKQYIFNVGQGNCQLATYRSKIDEREKNIGVMYDCGSKSSSKGSYISNIKSVLSDVDLLIVFLSHPDLDHYNMLADLMENNKDFYKDLRKGFCFLCGSWLSKIDQEEKSKLNFVRELFKDYFYVVSPRLITSFSEGRLSALINKICGMEYRTSSRKSINELYDDGSENHIVELNDAKQHIEKLNNIIENMEELFSKPRNELNEELIDENLVEFREQVLDLELSAAHMGYRSKTSICSVKYEVHEELRNAISKETNVAKKSKALEEMKSLKELIVEIKTHIKDLDGLVYIHRMDTSSLFSNAVSPIISFQHYDCEKNFIMRFICTGDAEHIKNSRTKNSLSGIKSSICYDNKFLLADLSDCAHGTILVAPHHGSGSDESIGATIELIRLFNPDFVYVSAGESYKFPKEKWAKEVNEILKEKSETEKSDDSDNAKKIRKMTTEYGSPFNFNRCSSIYAYTDSRYDNFYTSYILSTEKHGTATLTCSKSNSDDISTRSQGELIGNLARREAIEYIGNATVSGAKYVGSSISSGLSSVGRMFSRK